jgi:hypothetical protein
MSKQTAVEWLEENYLLIKKNKNAYFQQAKEMEKQKLEQFYNHGAWAIIEHGHGESFEDYYNKTFNK